MSDLHGTEVILLAGGLGTRLKSVVPGLPKPMAPIAGQPFLMYLLRSLESQGFTRAILSVGYLASVVQDHFGDRMGSLNLAYSVEERPLGTGGAILAAARLACSDHVFAVNGDTYASVDYAAMLAQHRSMQGALSVALIHVADTERYGAVDVVGSRIRSFTEKGRSGPGYINAGIYLFKREALEDCGLPESFSFEHEVLRDRMEELSPAAFLSSGYFVDIGMPEDYARAQQELPDHVHLYRA